MDRDQRLIRALAVRQISARVSDAHELIASIQRFHLWLPSRHRSAVQLDLKFVGQRLPITQRLCNNCRGGQHHRLLVWPANDLHANR